MLNPNSTIGQMLDAPMRPGVVAWIGVRPARRAGMLAVASAVLDPEVGLCGDHYRAGVSRKRQVTLMGDLELEAVGRCLGFAVTPEQLRRNIVVSGINLFALRGCRFTLGAAVLEATGECHPCSRMEEVFGVGGYNACRGRGGITARVVTGGEVRLGDAVLRGAPIR